jgi:hypothetical protein
MSLSSSLSTINPGAVLDAIADNSLIPTCIN